ncbi:phage tail protein [Croceiramulus getboli]|nr:phage tail protein [Flavobacteriaceae bacterium YJPT1-3]
MSEFPLSSYHFLVEWGGTRVGFTDVQGLKLQTDVMEYREGSSPVYIPVKIPGMQRYANLVLKRGVMREDHEFYEWVQTQTLNKIERRDLVVQVLNEVHEPALSYRIRNAWPVALSFSNLNAAKSKFLFERIELAHEGFSLVS